MRGMKSAFLNLAGDEVFAGAVDIGAAIIITRRLFIEKFIVLLRIIFVMIIIYPVVLQLILNGAILRDISSIKFQDNNNNLF